MYVLTSFSFKLIVNFSFSKKWCRLLVAFIARIFLLLISSSVLRSVPRSLQIQDNTKPPFFKISRLKLQKLLKSCWPNETES